LEVGRPKWGIISWISVVGLVEAHLFEVGKASTVLRRCLPELGDICVI
jgi:hypothetical protein